MVSSRVKYGARIFPKCSSLSFLMEPTSTGTIEISFLDTDHEFRIGEDDRNKREGTFKT